MVLTARCVVGVDLYSVCQRLRYPFDWFHQRRLAIDGRLNSRGLIRSSGVADKWRIIARCKEYLLDKNDRMSHFRWTLVTMGAKKIADLNAAAGAISAWW